MTDTPGFEHVWDQKSVEFDLRPNSVVFEIGGYKGRWAAEIARLYNPRLYVFEPQRWAFLECQKALAAYPKAKVFDYGLGAKTETRAMHEFETDGASFVNPSPRNKLGEGRLVEIREFMRRQRIKRVELCLMNIEGYEYVLIPHMLRTGVMDRIRIFMCQFHPVDQADRDHTLRLREQLQQGRNIVFNHGTTLTCWEKL